MVLDRRKGLNAVAIAAAFAVVLLQAVGVRAEVVSIGTADIAGVGAVAQSSVVAVDFPIPVGPEVSDPDFGVRAVTLSLTYDDSVIDVTAASAGAGLDSGCVLASDLNTAGTLAILIACASAIVPGELVVLQLEGRALGSTPLTVSACLLNEGAPACVGQAGGANVLAPTATPTPVPPTATSTMAPGVDTPTPTATDTVAPATSTATATDTPPPATNTATALDTATSTETATPTATATVMPATSTATATDTVAPIPTATHTPPPTSTFTQPPTATFTQPPPATASPTPSPGQSGSVNLSEGKSATQISTSFGAVASRAVDGNTNGVFGQGSVTHTAGAANPWWEVDLGSPANIDRVDIWNRTDCCGTQVSNYYVLVSNQPNPRPGDPGIFERLEAAPAGSPTLVPVNATGRYVRIYKNGPGVLTIAEVQVWGEAAAVSNLSQGKSATQISTILGAEAGRAVDGNTDGRFGAGSVTHTAGAANAWWEVDLGSVSNVERVDVWNRTDCCTAPVSNYYVLVSNQPNPRPGDPGIFEHFEVSPAGSPTSVPVNATGRYVRIYKNGPGVLTIAEVQVWGEAAAVSNLSQGKSATQISTILGAEAGRAVDGNTNGRFGAGSVTHTAGAANAWWEVDLGSVVNVQRIDVWNRTDCCTAPVSNYYVLVSNQPNPTPGDPGIFEHFEVSPAGSPTSVPVNATGRYVRIYKNGPGVLTIAEVQVWGEAAAVSNLSDGKSATQISTILGAEAGRAVDGNTDGRFGAGSVTHTAGAANAWWEVDLGSVSNIERIDVWNRTDCCAAPVSNYYVLVSDQPNPEPGDPGIFEHFEAPAAGTPTSIPIGATGQYVRIYKDSPGGLTIAEVQVWGTVAQLDSQYVGQSVSAVLFEGETRQVSLRFRNAGDVGWSDGAGYSLGWAGTGPSPWGASEVLLEALETIPPGSEKSFHFDIVAPNGLSFEEFRWRMQRNGTPLGENSPPVSIEVVAPSGVSPYSLRFLGTGSGDVDRVKIQIDDPALPNDPGPPADVGADDFTIELWIKGSASDNDAPLQACGTNINWINGNIVVDRDRFNQGRKFGLSIAGGAPIFGVSGDSSDLTICGATDVVDGQWHHVAVQRRRSDGQLSMYVDGVLESSGVGPTGDVSYPDDGVPCSTCCGGGSCDFSDPFLVIGAEKHDADNSQFPSFAGLIDEIRISDALRYSGTSFPLPSGPFQPDGDTAALYHLDEGNGDRVTDSAAHPAGPSPGRREFGGNPAGPEWSTDSPFPATPALSLVPMVSGLTQVVAIANAGDHRLFLVERDGRILIHDGTQLLPTPFLDIDSLVGSVGSEQGLLGLAFHPNYLETGYFFVNYTDNAGDTVVARYQRRSTSSDLADPASAAVLLTVGQPQGNHNGGDLHFGDDGYLYIGLGDGGGGGDGQCFSQRDDTLLGKMLRIDVDQNTQTAPFYGIPGDNPYVGGGDPADEVWAHGLRNPWRFAFDRTTYGMFIGDVGQRAIEEINYQNADSLGGENYGWKVMEGTACYILDCPNGAPNCNALNCPAGLLPCNDPGFELPIVEYDHSEGCSVAGGYVYRGRMVPELNGTYVYGDFCVGTIWGATHDAAAWTGTPLADTSNIYAFGEDSSGEVYLSRGTSISRVQGAP